jgi:hypothetical protein
MNLWNYYEKSWEITKNLEPGQSSRKVTISHEGQEVRKFEILEFRSIDFHNSLA